MFNKLVPVLFIATILVSCAKEKEYDKVYTEPELQSKLDFPVMDKATGEKTKFLYVPMTLGTPRQVKQANPFYQGQTKLVNIEFTEAGLAVHEVEADDRFSENDLNRSPVMLIPGKYKDFQCKEDEFGDCTNTEEENTEVTWDKKKYFLPDYKELKVQEVNMLDLVNVEGSDCVQNTKVALVDYEISKEGIINIELEKTYQLSKKWECIRSNYINDNLSSNSFKVRFFYSMVKLDTLASPDYEPMVYPIADHSVFGFFKSESKKLDGMFDPSRKNIEHLVNRWNPKKKVLRYYLSKSYNKPSNKAILDVTMKSMHVMNKNLAAAGVNFKLEFVQQTADQEISPGDLRYNSIVLIDDPLANGLLGYAPSVKNPETGEIVQSHINMYGGVLKSGTKYMYEQAIDIMKDQKKRGIQVKSGMGIMGKTLVSDTFPEDLIAENLGIDAARKNSPMLNRVGISGDLHTQPERIQSLEQMNSISIDQLNRIEKAKLRETVNFKAHFDAIMSGKIEGVDEIEKQIIAKQRADSDYSLDQSHAPEFFPIAGTVKVVYPGLRNDPELIGSDGILKPWLSLTEKQKEKVATIIMVHRYASTFVHEVGHSLGLRHNFAGSTDGENFYTDTEAQLLGMEKAPAYSSVMDYAISTYNELSAFGKYDVAALKYGYSQKIATKNNKKISVADKKVSLRSLTSSHNEPIEKQFVEDMKTLGVEIPGPNDNSRFYNALHIAGTMLESAEVIDLVKEAIKEFKVKLDDRIVEYEFCTDENASLSTKCNKHDEGTTLVEIAKHRIERYKNLYKLRNFRDGKNKFDAYGIDSYIEARYQELYAIRDLMEDYEFYANEDVYGIQTMTTGCGPEGVAKFPWCKNIQDRIDSIKIVGDFFLEILKTPDLMCAVVSPEKPNVVIGYKKLQEIYDDIKYTMNKYLVTSCFDEEVKKKIAEKDYVVKGEEGLIVVGENGKFLNGFKDTNPNYKYITDRAVRGYWPDKVLAFRMLFQRRARSSTTDTEHMALVDVPSIRAGVENFLKHVTLGKPLANPVPFTTENGQQFTMPYVIGNDYMIDQLEDVHATYKSKAFYMPKHGDANLIETMLKQMNKIGTNFEEEIADKVYEASNLVSVRKVRAVIDDGERNEDLETHIGKNVIYHVGPENKLAFHMVAAMNLKPELDKIGQERVIEIFNFRFNPTPPEEIGAAQKLFWNLEKDMQNILINRSQEDQTVPENVLGIEAFVGSFGEEDGPLLFKLFQAAMTDKAAELKGLVAMKDEMRNVPVEGTPENEKLLYKYEIETLRDLLTDFVNGVMTPEMFKFYNKQLKKLPQHFDMYRI